MKKIVLLMVLAAASTFATVALGQDPTTPAPGGWIKSVAAFLYNPITLAVAGIAIQFAPGVRAAVGNHVSPFLTTLMAWVGGLINPAGAALGAWMVPNDPTSSTSALLSFIGSVTPMAHADAGTASIGVIGLFGIGLGGLFGGIGGAALQAMQGYLIQRMYAWPGKILPSLPKDSK